MHPDMMLGMPKFALESRVGILATDSSVISLKLEHTSYGMHLRLQVCRCTKVALPALLSCCLQSMHTGKTLCQLADSRAGQLFAVAKKCLIQQAHCPGGFSTCRALARAAAA